MELFFVVLVCLFFLVLIFAGRIYFKMDTKRFRANACVLQMKHYLNEWVEIAVEKEKNAIYHKGSESEFQESVQQFFSYMERKNMLRIIPVLNTIAKLTGSINDPMSNVKQDGLDNDDSFWEQSEALLDFYMLITEYNRSVREFNNLLNKKIHAIVARITNLAKLEELDIRIDF